MNVLALLNWLGIDNPALQPAALTGLFSLLGIVLTGLFATVAYLLSRSSDRAARKRLRQEKTRDLQTAIRAEVRAHWYELNDFGDLEALRDSDIASIEAGRWVQPSFTPFVLRQAPSVVFDTIQSDLALLDNAVIQICINYYRQLALASQLAEDLRAERYAQLPADRKIQLISAYYVMLTTLKANALELNSVMERALKLKRRQRDTNMGSV